MAQVHHLRWRGPKGLIVLTKKTVTPGMRLDPEVRRQQILDAAITYFSEAGFGVQTRELSRRLGISQPLLYRYFPSKQDLINAVFDAVFMSKWDEAWIAGLQDRSLPLRDRLLRFYLQYAGATYQPEWIRIYMYAGLSDLDMNRTYLGLVRKKLLVFYWAVRHNIFNMKSATPFEMRTTDAIDIFLAGAKTLYPQIVAKAPRTKSKGATGSDS